MIVETSETGSRPTHSVGIRVRDDPGVQYAEEVDG